jgi:hypothetical protein
MTVLSTLVIVAVLAALALLAGRLGADSRPKDPDRRDAQWPFARHEG